MNWTGVIVWKSRNRDQIGAFGPCGNAIGWMTLKNNRAPLLCPKAKCIISYPFVNSNRSYDPDMLKLGQNLFWLLWPWPLTSDFNLFAWKSLLWMVIAPENFMMIQWHVVNIVKKGVMGRRTNRWTGLCTELLGSSWTYWLHIRLCDHISIKFSFFKILYSDLTSTSLSNSRFKMAFPAWFHHATL